MITVDEINEAWGWVGLNAEEVLGENAFGNLIIRDDEGRYWRLAPQDLCCEPVAEDRAALDAAMIRLPTPPGRKRLDEWRALAEAGDFQALALALMELHYDPAYRRSSGKDARPILGAVELAGLATSDLDAAATAVVRIADEAATRD